MEITKSEKVIVQSVYDEGEEEDDEEDATSTNEDEKERIDGLVLNLRFSFAFNLFLICTERMILQNMIH